MDQAVKDIQNLLGEIAKLHQLSHDTMQQLNNNQLVIGRQITRKFPNMPKPNDSTTPKTFSGERPNDLFRFFEDLERLFETCNVEASEKATYIESYTTGVPRDYVRY